MSEPTSQSLEFWSSFWGRFMKSFAVFRFFYLTLLLSVLLFRTSVLRQAHRKYRTFLLLSLCGDAAFVKIDDSLCKRQT